MRLQGAYSTEPADFLHPSGAQLLGVILVIASCRLRRKMLKALEYDKQKTRKPTEKMSGGYPRNLSLQGIDSGDDDVPWLLRRSQQHNSSTPIISTLNKALTDAP